MLKKIIFYSFAAILLGIVIMLLPIALYFPIVISSLTSTATQTSPISGPTECGKSCTFTVYNATRNLSLSKAAQIYGENDVLIGGEGANIIFPLNILIPLILVISTGLLATLIVKIITRTRLRI